MLVLTRKKGESVMIGKEIEVVVLGITPTQIRLGVQAPQKYSIFRKEIFLEIEEENLQAARHQASAVDLEAVVKKLWQELE